MRGTHVVVAVVLLLGCQMPDEQGRASETPTLWGSVNAPAYDPSYCVEVPSSLVRPVVGSLRRENANRLIDASILEITDADANRLIGNQIMGRKAVAVQLIESFLHGQQARKYRAEVEHRDSWSFADQDEFADLTSRSERNEFDDFKPYLVRAVAKHEGTGSFIAGTCGRDLHVHHVSLGISTPPSTQVPVVVFLAQQPQRVFVTWSMAE